MWYVNKPNVEVTSENRQAKSLSLTDCFQKGSFPKISLECFDANDLALFLKTALASTAH